MVALKQKDRLKVVPYSTPQYEVNEKGTVFHYENQKFPLKIFGAHNLQNLYGALNVVEALGVKPTDFLKAMKNFTGAGKRLEKVSETPERVLYKDFAHSPSKLKATTSAVKEQYPKRKLVACMELHTFSSLKKDFLPQYKDAMKNADKALVYFSPKVVEHKKLDPITKEDVYEAFGKNRSEERRVGKE